jgi:hypothetical protein
LNRTHACNPRGRNQVALISLLAVRRHSIDLIRGVRPAHMATGRVSVAGKANDDHVSHQRRPFALDPEELAVDVED